MYLIETKKANIGTLRLKATRLHHKREAALVKVTKIKDDKFAENNVCS